MELESVSPACCREIVGLLLKHQASPNIVDRKGSSPLHLAAWAAHIDIVYILLTTGIGETQINLRVSNSVKSNFI